MKFNPRAVPGSASGENLLLAISIGRPYLIPASHQGDARYLRISQRRLCDARQ